MDKLTAVAARVMRENPHLDPESVQAGVNAALQEVYSVAHERHLKWRDSQDAFAKAREAEARSLGHLVFQLHGG
jgi:limonene-1,2-epoxide hydrolase